MVHILILVLKVIGILLLVLLGLVLSIACLILFVPVRYEAGGSWKEKPNGGGKISWLFGAVSLKAGYDGNEEALTAGVRLFGRTLWEMGGNEEMPEESGQEPRPAAEKAIKREAAEKRTPETGKNPAEQRPTASEKAHKPPKQTKAPENRPETEAEGRKKKLKFSFLSFCDKLKDIRNGAEAKKAWLEDEKNKASLKLLWKQAKRFLRHVGPRAGKGFVAFGLGDPYLTGQALSAAALIYPFFEGNVEICPVFDEKVFEAEGSFKGRIRAGYLLWLGLGILRDRHTRRMLFGFLKGSAV